MTRRILKPGPLELAKEFHDTYVRLAIDRKYYETRNDSHTDWESLSANNRALLMATANHILTWLEESMWIGEKNDQTEVTNWIIEEEDLTPRL